MVIDPIVAGAAFVTYWLRGRYGNVSELPPADRRRRWRVEPAWTGRPTAPPYELHFEEDALARDLGHLREWLEAVAEDALNAAPEPPGHYMVSARDGVTRTAAGASPQTVRRAG